MLFFFLYIVGIKEWFVIIFFINFINFGLWMLFFLDFNWLRNRLFLLLVGWITAIDLLPIDILAVNLAILYNFVQIV